MSKQQRVKLVGNVAARVGVWLHQNKDLVSQLTVDEISTRLKSEKIVDTSSESLLRLLRSMDGEIKFKEKPLRSGGMSTISQHMPHIRSILKKVVHALGERELGLTKEELDVLNYEPQSKQKH